MIVSVNNEKDIKNAVEFVGEDLSAAIAGKEVLIEPNSPSEGITVAFIVDDGAQIEFLEFTLK